jgi:PAS domain S-box-containing protein
LAQELSDEYVVDTAANGVEALKSVMRRRPDLIVTDIVMPLMDGVELLKTLRSEPQTIAVPVLLISGRAQEAQRIEGFREGADGYLAKPYSVRELRAMVGSMLQAAEQRAEATRREAREQAEELALAERAALLESITDAFFALDRQQRFTYINQRALDHFNGKRETLLGRPIREVFPTIRDTLLEAQIERALHEQRPGAFEMLSAVVGRWAEFHVYPTGQGLAVYFRDISDRKKAEQELQLAQDSLRESDRRKNEFLAQLAHELRNPLAPIGNGLQVLRVQATANPASGRILEIMQRQLNHLVRLVDDLLDIGRITQGKLQLRLQRVSLTDVVASAVESTRGLIEDQEHQLEVDIRARDLVVQGDPDRLVQVFANLLANSARYTNRGGRVVLTLDRESEHAVITVADNGIGIDRKSLVQVFEMFAQLGTHPGRDAGGLGIGLALVQRIVHMHEGSVSAASEGPGKGSVFTVRLPLVDPHLEIERTEEDPSDRSDWEALRGAGHRVLVVDDNEDAATSLQLLLELLGYEVSIAADAEQAVDLARRMQPQIIFMDLGLPEVDGVEACRRIRALPQSANVPVVALTGWGQANDRERTRAAGMVSHLVKPVRAQDLHAVLASLGLGPIRPTHRNQL